MDDLVEFWGIREIYPVEYTPDIISKLDAYIDALLVYIKNGSPNPSEMYKQLVPLVFHPIEYEKRLAYAMEAQKIYDDIHRSPSHRFCDSICCYDKDEAWYRIDVRLDQKIKSMRQERALLLESQLEKGLFEKRDKWLEYAFYRAEYTWHFRDVIVYLSEKNPTPNVLFDYSIKHDFPWGIFLFAT